MIHPESLLKENMINSVRYSETLQTLKQCSWNKTKKWERFGITTTQEA